jgi:glycolate oxidase
MIKAEALKKLTQFSFISEKDFSLKEREKYSQDHYKQIKAFPEVIVRPKNSKEIKQIINFANKYKIPLTCRGGGTATTGSAIPIKGGILLSFEKMKRILEIDTENKIIVCEPGVFTADIHKAAEAVSLFYPPDPASAAECTIGGNIMTNAGGIRALKYGVTRNYVLGLEGFWANGLPFKLGGKILKEQVGYDLKQLLIGSEGTLGIITKITLKLIPKPKYSSDLLLSYTNYNDALQTLSQIEENGIKPSTAEFFNNFAIVSAEKYLKKSVFFKNIKVAFLLQIDGNDENKMKNHISLLKKIAKQNSVQQIFPLESDTQNKLVWEVRKCLSTAFSNLSQDKISLDPVIPLSKIPEYMKYIEDIDQSTDLKVVGFGHLGDGNVHINILNLKSTKKVWEKERKIISQKLLKNAISLGGAISGEHGIGLAKKPYLNLIYKKEYLKLLKNIKTCFDPQNILNPEKII